MSGRKAGYKDPPLTDAQRDLVAEHRALAYLTVFRLGRGLVEHDDAVQEACLGLMYSARSYDPSAPRACKPSTYLGFGARSKLFAARKSAARRLAREAARPRLDAAYAAGEPPRELYEPPAGLREARARLGASDRELLSRHYLDGTPVKLLCRQLGVTRQAVQERLQGARRRLRVILESQPEGGAP